MRHADRLQTFGHQADQHAAREELVRSAYSSSAAIIAMAAACSRARGQQSSCTYEWLNSQSELRLTPDLQLGTRHSRAVTGHAAEATASSMREREVFLRSAFRFHGHTPV